MTPPYIRPCRISELDEDSELYDAAIEYALRPRTTTCGHCGRTETASQMEVEKRGWSLSKLGERCSCTRIVHSPIGSYEISVVGTATGSGS